jgi:ADP-heptose:LPS heptosyltransferase
MAEPILFQHGRAAGDIVVMTAAVRDLAVTYPGKYEIHVSTSCRSLWQENPHVFKNWGHPPADIPRHKLTYGAYIPRANRSSRHFITAFHQNLQERLSCEVPVLQPKGALYLDDWHKQNPPMNSRYWYFISGGKSDFTTKIWSATRWQQTINILRQFGLKFVQDGALHRGHRQPPIEGALSTVNKTNLRDMMWLIYHSDGVICGVTCAMHMAAALDKPCVVIAGGREHYWWEAYTNWNVKEQFGDKCAPVNVPHQFLHTQDLLDCCNGKGCWKNKVTPAEPDKGRSYCKHPVDDGYGQIYPECMQLIEPAHVVEAVLSYYEGSP